MHRRTGRDVAGKGNPNGAKDPAASVPVAKDGGLKEEKVRVVAEIAVAPSREAVVKAMLEASADCVVVVGRDGFMKEVNRCGLTLFEAGSTKELAALPMCGFVSGESHEAYLDCLERLWGGEKGFAEFECLGLCGSRRWVEMNAAPVRGERGEVAGFLAILRDTTERRELTKQFIQAQKMEVVGHLAGGVAHDFNNMLGIIMGFAEMLLSGAAPGSRQHEDAQAIFHTAQRAAALTRQILIFSREHTPKAEKVDLGGMIMEMDRMVRRLIGENIHLVTKPEPELGLVEADPVQIEQVLMNLTVNARDAMPNGGTLTIETRNAAVGEGDAAHPGVKPGKYAVLSVSDTGGGMTDEVKAKMFKAFFTTKPEGKGTGLGLSTCQNIVGNWRGQMVVESAPGAGATFKVYLPCIERSAEAEKAGEQDGLPPRGTETVLVVEDEIGLLSLTAVVLERQGYRVLKAANGSEALAIVHGRRAGAIDLVVTDLVMPEMGGRIMAQWVRAFDPKIKVLFTSGYAEVGNSGGIEIETNFIAKPYTPTDLLRKVRKVIDAVEGEAGTPGVHDASADTRRAGQRGQEIAA